MDIKLHKVTLAKGHQLIDAISQCVDFLEGEYKVRPTILKHNNIEMMRDCAFSSLIIKGAPNDVWSKMKRASVQRIYGMDVTRSTKVNKDVVVLAVRDGSKVIDMVQLTTNYGNGKEKADS